MIGFPRAKMKEDEMACDAEFHSNAIFIGGRERSPAWNGPPLKRDDRWRSGF